MQLGNQTQERRHSIEILLLCRQGHLLSVVRLPSSKELGGRQLRPDLILLLSLSDPLFPSQSSDPIPAFPLSNGTQIPWLQWGNGTGDAQKQVKQCGPIVLEV